MSAENWTEALELAESPDAFERPSTAFDTASWVAANAAAVRATGFGAAADLAALTETATAMFGVIPGETGVRLGEMDGAADGIGIDNDKTLFGIVPKTGIPGSEGLELAPAALYAPIDEGTEMRTDWT